MVLKTRREVCGTDTLSHCHLLCSSTHIPVMAALSLMVMGGDYRLVITHRTEENNIVMDKGAKRGL